MSTIKDVAKVAGVSSTTVSRVLNYRGYLSSEIKQKVYQAMEELAYQPNELARALLNNKSNIIGLIFPSITVPFHAELVQYIESLLRKNGYKIMLCLSLGDREKEKEYLRMLKMNQVDGIIVGTHNDNIPDYNISNLPVVAIDRFLGDNVTTISCDNYAGGKMAVECLLEKGCKNIALLRGPSNLKKTLNKRTRAYIDIMKTYGLPTKIIDANLICSIEEKNKIIQEALAQSDDIDGIFATDDLLAALAINIVKKTDKRIPEDIKIIGFDGAKMTLTYLPQLATIQQPIETIAQTAVDLLLRKISGEQVEDVIDLPVRLIEGEII